jgi:Niemann-Pick C1 protein
MLLDMRRLAETYGLPGTFSYAGEYLDYETYFNFTKETLTSCALSTVAIIFVIIFITASLSVTMLVTFCVLLVDLFLVGMIHFWSLTFNTFVVINIVIALGLSVDYSAHIAHSYLNIVPPEYCVTDKQKRMYKAKTALSKMGSSVFHGGFSTFLAIVVLSPSKTYIFMVFFRCWFGIILFGMSNGFLLLPVLLSYVGPTQGFGHD